MLKLGGKLILGVLITLGSILSLGFYFVMEKQSDELLGEVRQNAISISQIVSSSVGEFLGEIQYHYVYLQDLTEQMARLTGVEYIAVFDKGGGIVAHTHKEHVGLHASADHISLIDKVFQRGKLLDEAHPDQQTYIRFIPIFDSPKRGKKVIGVVEVVMPFNGLSLEQADGVTEVVRESISQVLMISEEKKAFLSKLVDQIRSINSVGFLEVYNEQIMLLSSDSYQNISAAQLSSNIKHVFKTGRSEEMDDFWQGYYQHLSPIFSSDKPAEVIGVVRLVMDLQPALAKIESLSETMRLIAVAVAIGIFIVLSLLLERILVDPLRSLSDAAQKLSRGVFNKVPIAKSRDEIAELGTAFNNMIDNLEQYQEQLITAKEYNENILRTMGDALFIVSLDGKIEQLNDATLVLLQYPRKNDLVGLPVNLVCSDQPHHSQQTFSFWMDGSEFTDEEKYLITRNGCYVPVLLSFSYFYDIDGYPAGAVCVARDITERKRTEEALQRAYDELEVRVNERTKELFKEKERLQVTLRSIGDAVITVDKDGRVDYLNPVAEKVTGWHNDEVLGRQLSVVLPLFDEFGNTQLEDPIQKCLSLGECGSVNTQMTLHNQEGKQVAIESTAAPIRDNQGEITGVIIVFRDVSEERKLRNQLVHQARHDALTGLANRRVFEQQLADVLGLTRDKSVIHAVLFLDLDQFKVVNDTCGHVAGDALLQQLTSLLREKMRATDVLARLGGDEFGVILRSCSLDQAKKIASVLLDTVREFRFSWEGKSFELGVSIGLVMVDELSESVASVMSAADVACYAAKDGGRNRYHIYESSDEDLAQRHGEMQWVTLITKALEEDRFALYLQSIQSLTGRGADKHYEVLIRMLDEQGAIIPPGAFLPAAERYGLMGNIDRWVISHVFKILTEQLEQGGVALNTTFAINLSGLSIGDSDFLAYIKQLFEEYPIPPEMICFEITETAAVASLTTASQFIKELRVTGCKFALDDFGSGLSSFSYLKNLPVDYLKIDGIFVRDMVDDAIDYAMVEAINRIGQVMGIKTIAEFVENEAILNCLVAIEVDYAQGYHIDKPHPIEELFGNHQLWQVVQK